MFQEHTMSLLKFDCKWTPHPAECSRETPCSPSQIHLQEGGNTFRKQEKQNDGAQLPRLRLRLALWLWWWILWPSLNLFMAPFMLKSLF